MLIFICVCVCVTPAQECFGIPSAFPSRDVRSPPGRGWAEKGRLQYLIRPCYDPKNSAAADKAVKSIGVYLQGVRPNLVGIGLLFLPVLP